LLYRLNLGISIDIEKVKCGPVISDNRSLSKTYFFILNVKINIAKENLDMLYNLILAKFAALVLLDYGVTQSSKT